ncbi:MAG: glutamine--fructose-6-phosphate transaminase (isomerizing), partial [Patescibacteria group bacterium]
MCGIFGYRGKRLDAGKIVVEGLKNLEYRGYDSWGVACMRKEGISVKKDIGKISAVESDDFSESCCLALAHTRWATHGGVTPANAHPHLSRDGSIAVVHNGIIENHLELKEELSKKGYAFVSQTDTEVIPYLIEEEMKSGKEFPAAFRSACVRFHGRYAILAFHEKSGMLVASRTGSPLIVGVGSDGYYIASDIPAFVSHTRTVQYIDDGEMVETDGETITFRDIATGEERQKREIKITWTEEQSEKGSFAHFMIKEIMEEPVVVKRLLVS